jgi:hypothetical protein
MLGANSEFVTLNPDIFLALTVKHKNTTNMLDKLMSENLSGSIMYLVLV